MLRTSLIQLASFFVLSIMCLSAFCVLDSRLKLYVCTEVTQKIRNVFLFSRGLFNTSNIFSRIKNYYLNAETQNIVARTHAQNMIFFRFDSHEKKATKKGKSGKKEGIAFEMFVYNHLLRQMLE